MDTSKIPTSPLCCFFFCWVTADNLIHTWYCFFTSFMNRFVYLNKWPGRRVPRNVVFGKGPCVYVRVYVYVCVLEGVCVVSGPVIEPCQAPRAKPSLLDRNCLFTGYTTVCLKTIGLAGLLHRTPFRYRFQTSGSSYPTSLLYFSRFLNCPFF